MNDSALSDIQELYNVYRKGGNILDAFVKPFPAAEAAAKTLKPGDIAHTGNSGRISIMMPNGSLKQLNLSPKKYFELFPPVERYAFSQGQTGDCRLDAFLHSANENVYSRAYLLSCFNENENGDVSVKFPNGKTEYIEAFYRNLTIEDFLKNFDEIAYFPVERLKL